MTYHILYIQQFLIEIHIFDGMDGKVFGKRSLQHVYTLYFWQIVKFIYDYYVFRISLWNFLNQHLYDIDSELNVDLMKMCPSESRNIRFGLLFVVVSVLLKLFT